MANLKIKDAISRALARLEALKSKYRTWDPIDRNTMAKWGKRLEAIRQQSELADHPTMKNWIRYCVTARESINHILMNDKALLTDPAKALERATLMDKRDFYQKALEIFLPHSEAVERIEREIMENLTVPYTPQNGTREYPHAPTRASDYGL